MCRVLVRAVLLCLAVAVTRASAEDRRVVIYDGTAHEVRSSTEPSKDLWVTMEDLKSATRYVVKPQGVCRDDLCYPLPKARKAEFIARRGAASWFNLSEFARLINQPIAADEKHQVWYFGPRSQDINSHLLSLEAPGFSLPDINGKLHSLSDFQGKKVLLLTWASW
jgi:hypothetical protein